MEGTYAATMGTTWVACQNALKEVGINIIGSIKEKPNTGWSKVGLRVEMGWRLTWMPYPSDKVTRVSVRVGIFGDKQLSIKI